MVPVRCIPLDISEDWLSITEGPDFFAEGLDTHWHDARHAVFYLLLDPQQRTTVDWRTLGRQLVTMLIEDNAYIGLCFDGDPAFDDRVLRWLSLIREHTNQVRVEAGVVELKWITSPHRRGEVAISTRPGPRSRQQPTQDGYAPSGMISTAALFIMAAT